MAYAPGFIRITTAAVASVLLALAPLAAAFLTQFELERGSLALVDPKLGGSPHAHETELTAVTFDGASAITSSYDGMIKLWDLRSGKLTGTLSVSPAPSTPNALDKEQRSQVEPSGARAPMPLAVALGTDGRPIVMTDEGVALDDGKGNLVVVPYRGLTTGSSFLPRPALDVVNATPARHAVARNWFPRRGGINPFVALAVPGMTNTYAVGEPDGRIAIETSDARTTESRSSSGGVAGICIVNCGPVVTSRTEPPTNFPRHTGPVTGLAVTAGGKLASISDDGSVIVWTLKDGQFVAGREISKILKLTEAAISQGHTDIVRMAKFSPDGRRIVTASDDQTVRIWDVTSGKEIAILRGHEDGLNSAAFSPDGRRIITASDDQTVRIWDVASGKEIAILRGYSDGLNSAAFSPDGRVLITASADKTARLWDAGTRRLRGALQGHTGDVYSAAFSPDGKRIVTASADKTARLWDAETGKPIGEPLQGHTGDVYSAAFSPDGKRIVTASADETARLWDAETGKPIGEPLQGHTGDVYSAAFSPDGKRIVTASADETALLWDAETGKQIGEPLQGHTGDVYSAAFSPDGKRIVTASADKTARLWDAETGKQIGEPLAGLIRVRSAEKIADAIRTACTPCVSVAFSADGERLITAGASGVFQVWNSETGELVGEFRQDFGINVARLSKDGQIAVIAGDDGAARLLDVGSGEPLAIIRGHGDAINQAELTPDGTHLVTASRDGTVRVTSLSQAQQLNLVDPVRLYRQFAAPWLESISGILGDLRERVAASKVADEGRQAPADAERAASDAEAQRKSEEAEQQRLAAAKADEERKAEAAAVAEARRKAEEEEQRQAKAAADAEAKRKAAEAEQQRLREEVQRQSKAASDAEAKRKSAEEQQRRAAVQQPGRVRRVGVLMGISDDPEGQARVAVFRQALDALGWTEGLNVQFIYRWSAGDVVHARQFAKELLDLRSDVILANSTPVTVAVRDTTRTTPTVFVQVSDPVTAGVVQSLARPGGNLTGFTNFEPSMPSKWLELVKHVAPNVTRVAYLFNPDTAPLFYARAVEAAAPLLSVKPFAAEVRNAAEMERVIEQFARESGSALLVLPDLFTSTNRQSIIALAARHRLPAVYPFRYFVTSGGLMSYAIDMLETYRQAASYVDRILKGEKPADLPVQAPTKYELVINLKTARALGLEVPATLLARADEVIE